MEDLPVLPFEQILSYLSLEDRLKSRAVSRSWRNKFDFKVKSLCYSDVPSGRIFGKSRLTSGAFAHNFISSTQFARFFNKFRRTILFNLKHLRLCVLCLTGLNGAAFAPTLQSFGQLEQLDIVRFNLRTGSNRRVHLELNLPMLTSIHLENVSGLDSWDGLEKLTVDAPRLRKVKLLDSPTSTALQLEIVHTDSVERLVTFQTKPIAVKKLRNLKYLYTADIFLIDSTFLFYLEQLKEIHLTHAYGVSKLFEQKQLYGRADLKIYYYGLLLNGPDDPASKSPRGYHDDEYFGYLVENQSRMADQIPFHSRLGYTATESVDPGLVIDILKRFTSLDGMHVKEPVQDIKHFLEILKSLDHIAELAFLSAQPQDLFDRLPDHSAVQYLTILREPLDLRFLFRLQHLNRLHLAFTVDADAIRKVFEELPFLSLFRFDYIDRGVQIQRNHSNCHSLRFQVSVDVACQSPIGMNVPDLNAAIQFITETVDNLNRSKESSTSNRERLAEYVDRFLRDNFFRM